MSESQTSSSHANQVSDAFVYRRQAAGSHDTATESNEEEVTQFRLPRAFETLGTPIRLHGRSRSFIMTLPPSGLSQVAQVIASAIDRHVPVANVDFDVVLDSEGTEELVAKVRVNLPAAQALSLWEELASQLYSARVHLDEPDKARMDDEFAFLVRWSARS